ncbi:MAG TPA: hypothetical protein VIH93_16445 [Thermoanaerobaculia bacterium]|jgi:hypothetical protein
MSDRQLHPREESYRWAIEKLDSAFGKDRVRITPRNYYHVISASVFSKSGEQYEELPLRSPTHDLNKRKDRERYLDKWIAEVQERFSRKPKAAKSA